MRVHTRFRSRGQSAPDHSGSPSGEHRLLGYTTGSLVSQVIISALSFTGFSQETQGFGNVAKVAERQIQHQRSHGTPSDRKEVNRREI